MSQYKVEGTITLSVSTEVDAESDSDAETKVVDDLAARLPEGAEVDGTDLEVEAGVRRFVGKVSVTVTRSYEFEVDDYSGGDADDLLNDIEANVSAYDLTDGDSASAYLSSGETLDLQDAGVDDARLEVESVDEAE